MTSWPQAKAWYETPDLYLMGKEWTVCRTCQHHGCRRCGGSGRRWQHVTTLNHRGGLL